MKLLSKITLVLGLFLGQVFAATGTSGVDENGRLWGSAYFDIISGVQTPVLGAMKYTNRTGFDWTKVYDNVKNFGAKELTYKISARAVIPGSITTDSAYITFGKNIKFWDYVSYYKAEIDSPASSLKVNSYPIYKLSAKVNEKELIVSDFTIAKIKQDDFGTRYIDFEINLIINLSSREDLGKQKLLVPKVIEKFYAKKMNAIRIKIAPKSRSFESKWQNAKIYVMDE
ncbi:MAG: hypothetical protein CL624_14275 [Arcobacter sp.]|nr:hypothetical protein [Arcobacter sp.]|tara:strand:- start:16064 stop:16747 length:684 start_codon:yes stop_codon:yes gene_type:complete